MKKLIIGILIISILIASFALYAGITHNPMDVFCIHRDICNFDYSYAVFIWFSWFIPAFFVPFIVIVIFKYLNLFLTKRSNRH